MKQDMEMNIKDIVEQVRETPSPRCWESIASQLPAAGAAAGGSAAATAAKSALSAGKLAAIIGSTAAVVAVVTGTTIAILKHEPKSDQQTVNQTNTTITIADSTITEDIDTENTTLLCQAEYKQISATQKAPTVPSSPANDVNEKPATTTPATNNPASSTIPSPVIPSSSTIVTPQNTTSASNQNINSVSNSTSDKTSTSNNTSAQTANTTSKQKSNQDNNVVVNNQDEEWSFSQPVIIEIPNIFTPNGDGVNDHFVINGLENCEKKMLIVKDRSGHIVFQSRSYDNSWDGGNLPDGSYYYQFSYSINNINELRQGTMLIRR